MQRRHDRKRRNKNSGRLTDLRALEPLLNRMDRVTNQATPYLVALAVGLGLLYVTCRLTLSDPKFMEPALMTMIRAGPGRAMPSPHLAPSHTKTTNGRNRVL